MITGDDEVIDSSLETTTLDKRYTRVSAPALSMPTESTQSLTDACSQEYFTRALDSLLHHRPPPLRIYPSASTPPLSIITSTDPIPQTPRGYAPYSYLSLLDRLRTYTPSSFSSFPEPLSALNLALSGWRAEPRDTLICGSCQASWTLKTLHGIRDGKIRDEVACRLGEGLGERHMRGCPWRFKAPTSESLATYFSSERGTSEYAASISAPHTL